MSTPRIPNDLLPADGRFGSGPTKVRAGALQSLAHQGAAVMGTSHRQAPVKTLVASVQQGLAELYDLPDGYEVVLGNGGSTCFWDLATFSLIERRSAHAAYGEFSAKFARAAARAPFLDDPVVTEVPAGSAALPTAVAEVDAYAWAHNETSTGAAAAVHRVDGADPGALTLIDATSAAGAMRVDVTEVDAYYFAPQKNFGSDGGLWLTLLSPAAIERAERLSTERWIPESLDLAVAIGQSRQHQTLNTPAIATLWLLDQQVRWLLEHGGLDFAAERCAASSTFLYAWADAHRSITPMVAPDHRSPVVATLDLDPSIDATAVTAVLRTNGIVDTEPYRKLGRNQVRIACYAPIDPADVQALAACIDWVLEHAPVAR